MDSLKINLDTKSFNVSSTLLYTLVIQFLLLILLVFVQHLYLWFSGFSFNYVTEITIKIMALILFICGCILLIYRQHYLFGRRIGEIIKIVNSDKKIDYNYKGYTYLFVNTIFTFIPLSVMFYIFLFLTDNTILINSAYITISIMLIIDVINIIISLLKRKKRFILEISKLDEIIIHFKDTTTQQYPLFKNSYRTNFIRIRYDNNVYIYKLDTIEHCLFEKDKIDTLTVGITTLKFDNNINKWYISNQIF